MALSISICPVENSIHMFGSTQTSSSYSLAGTVSLTLENSTSMLTAVRSRGVILTSLVLTFEGKSEHAASQIGYSGARLCTVSKELISRPLLVSTEGENSATYALIFDLTIPGWLPPSINAIHGPSMVGNSYSLFATATYSVQQSSSNFWNTCISSLLNHSKVHAPRVEIEVHRHRKAAPIGSDGAPTSFPQATFAISARARPTSPIPNDVVSKMQLVVSIPEYISTTGGKIPVTLRTRCKEIGLVATRLDVDLDQVETLYRSADGEYVGSYPLPVEQPPSKPLLHKHPLTSMRNLGIPFEEGAPILATRSILDPEAPSRFKLQEGSQEGNHTLTSDWSKLEFEVGFGSNHIRQKLDSPFLKVRHALRLALHVEYQGGEDIVQFNLPLQFVALPPNYSSLNNNNNNSESNISTCVLPPQYPSAPCILPAYVQLYHENGEAKIDPLRGIPPAYSESPKEHLERKVESPETIPIGTLSL